MSNTRRIYTEKPANQNSVILFGGMVVEEKRRSCNCGGFWRGTTLPLADTTGPLDVSRIFISSGVPERASERRGWPGLAGWMKAKSGRKRGTEGAAGPNTAVQMKK
jgi:hypothetical protein